jgi:hypothetical protein
MCCPAHGKTVYFLCNPDEKTQRFIHRVRWWKTLIGFKEDQLWLS